jgi:hypothetical protein
VFGVHAKLPAAAAACTSAAGEAPGSASATTTDGTKYFMLKTNSKLHFCNSKLHNEKKSSNHNEQCEIIYITTNPSADGEGKAASGQDAAVAAALATASSFQAAYLHLQAAHAPFLPDAAAAKQRGVAIAEGELAGGDGKATREVDLGIERRGGRMCIEQGGVHGAPEPRAHQGLSPAATTMRASRVGPLPSATTAEASEARHPASGAP